MAEPLLTQLGLNASEAADLPKREARNIVAFLLRWRAWQEALDILSIWGDDGFVTTTDARVRALTGLGKHAEAVAAMRNRERLDSLGAQALLAQTLLQAGELAEARTTADKALETGAEYGPLWHWSGAIHLATDNPNAAERAHLRHRELSPGSRLPPIGLALVSLARSDTVAADAYAVTALTLEGPSEQPTIEQLFELREIFRATGNATRLAEIEESLRDRYRAERDFLRETLESVTTTASKSRRVSREQSASRKGASKPRAAATPDLPPPTKPATAEEIAVTDTERKRLDHAVKTLFGFPALLPWQPQIIAATLRGEDVLAILPTGGGKSLTYQLPTFLHLAEEIPGAPPTRQPLTFVISPLIALMKDQVDNLPPKLRQRSIALTSTMSAVEQRAALEAIVRGEIELVYAAPERLRNPEFVATLAARGVGRLVIDEAHCVSSWGHNFRPDYLHIAQAHRDLGAPPILALTATAPVAVRQDIERHLFRTAAGTPQPGRTLRSIVADSFRENLLLGAIDCEDDAGKRAHAIALAKQFTGCGLIYARSRALCEELAEILRSEGESADFYHAGMPAPMRTATQNRFMSGEVRILVATVAFGMGIDKSDIRFIIHYGLPSSLEAYYQEAGRAGRDRQTAHCVLLYSKYDRTSLSSLASRDRLTIDTLRGVYAMARGLMNGDNPGIVSQAALLERLGALNETQIRVALSMLQEAEMVRRAYDAPRTVEIGWARPADDERLRALLQNAQIQPGETQQRDYLELARTSGIPPAELDLLCNRWAAQGKLFYRAGGREMLLERNDNPGATAHNATYRNPTDRVESVLSRFDAVQRQQVADIYAYARTKSCRHGYLSAYLGGHERNRCPSCNNCKPNTLPAIIHTGPDREEQRLIVLRAAERTTRGIVTLSKMLKGDATIDPRLHNNQWFGALNYLSVSSITGIVRLLVKEELLQLRDLDNGGQVVELAHEGRNRLRQNP